MQRQGRKLPLHLSQREVMKLTGNVRKDRHRLGLLLMAFGGLRVSEMCSLRVCDIHLARGFMKVLGKGERERIVPLNASLQKEIGRYLEKYGHSLSPDSFLIGGDRTSWHYVVKKYAKTNLDRDDVHCHTLRHSFATGLYEKEVPLERISEILGHARLDTTLIYAKISVSQKRDAVMVLDRRGPRLVSMLRPYRRRTDITVRDSGALVGREKELSAIREHISKGRSVMILGSKGCGKSAVLREIEGVHVEEYRKKITLVKILLSRESIDDPAVYKEAERAMKKLSVDELLDELKAFPKPIIIDDITDLSKLDRKTLARLAGFTTVVAASSRQADKKLFSTYLELSSLARHHTRLVLSEMVQINDRRTKERVIDDILHQAGENLAEASYIAGQMTMGKAPEEIITTERQANQVSIAPVLLIFVLFFIALVLKSYATTMVAISYALLVVFRLVFYRYLFTPASKR